MVGYTMEGNSRDRVLRLILEKDRIESEIRDQTAILETNGNVGMHEPLVDNEGYPRNDIDVRNVRFARHRIICLHHDHKDLMRRIEQGLADVHSQFLPQGQSNEAATTSNANGHMTNGHVNGHVGNGHGTAVTSSGDAGLEENDQGFATIGIVHNGSPADLAGLNEYDEILQFGSINSQNFTDISQLMNVVGHSIGSSINVVVKRDRHVLSLTVNPRPWAQPGLLGCQVLRRNN